MIVRLCCLKRFYLIKLLNNDYKTNGLLNCHPFYSFLHCIKNISKTKQNKNIHE